MEPETNKLTKEQLAEMVQQLTMQVATLKTQTEAQTQEILQSKDTSVGAKVMGCEPLKFSAHPGENLLIWERRVELYYFSCNIQGPL
ncbi:hypothetical protein IWQ62_004231 [Dispira parvispora]|uniref:Uncharacterized protein n=1 Tax=Dispira parvispora TaxID=1520584 RepID=A0A9W8E0V5_9FUNG|nr:hypothetical protein IWQ62_004231 [Dispira parvispora]